MQKKLKILIFFVINRLLYIGRRNVLRLILWIYVLLGDPAAKFHTHCLPIQMKGLDLQTNIKWCPHLYQRVKRFFVWPLNFIMGIVVCLHEPYLLRDIAAESLPMSARGRGAQSLNSIKRKAHFLCAFTWIFLKIGVKLEEFTPTIFVLVHSGARTSFGQH